MNVGTYHDYNMVGGILIVSLKVPFIFYMHTYYAFVLRITDSLYIMHCLVSVVNASISIRQQ